MSCSMPLEDCRNCPYFLNCVRMGDDDEKRVDD